MSEFKRWLVVQQQKASDEGWIIAARDASGVEQQLIGVYKSQPAAERWIEEHPGFWPASE